MHATRHKTRQDGQSSSYMLDESRSSLTLLGRLPSLPAALQHHNIDKLALKMTDMKMTEMKLTDMKLTDMKMQDMFQVSE